jgi:transposase
MAHDLRHDPPGFMAKHPRPGDCMIVSNVEIRQRGRAPHVVSHRHGPAAPAAGGAGLADRDQARGCIGAQTGCFRIFSAGRRRGLPIEEVRPHGKTPPQDLRRTISAVFRRHRNGAKWRRIPSELGPWWRAAQLFIRRARQGVWERLLEKVQQRDIALGMSFPDGRTPLRAPHKAAGAQKRGDSTGRDVREAPGRARGGHGPKACVIADGRGRAIALALAAGRAREIPASRLRGNDGTSKRLCPPPRKPLHPKPSRLNRLRPAFRGDRGRARGSDG